MRLGVVADTSKALRLVVGKVVASLRVELLTAPALRLALE